MMYKKMRHRASCADVCVYRVCEWRTTMQNCRTCDLPLSMSYQKLRFPGITNEQPARPRRIQFGGATRCCTRFQWFPKGYLESIPISRAFVVCAMNLSEKPIIKIKSHRVLCGVEIAFLSFYCAPQHPIKGQF